MTLIELRNHMMQVKMTSLAALCTLFKTEPETIRCLLRHWMRKGKIRQCSRQPACGSKCFKCPTESVELYEWVVS